MTGIPLETLGNASADITNGFGSSFDLTGVLMVVLWTVVIMALLLAARDSRYFDRLVDAFGAFALSVYYAIHGLAAVTALAVLTAPVYIVATADSSTKTAIGKYALYAIGAYLVLTVLGYLAKHHLFDPIRQNMDDAGLLPEPEDDVEEVAD